MSTFDFTKFLPEKIKRLRDCENEPDTCNETSCDESSGSEACDNRTAVTTIDKTLQLFAQVLDGKPSADYSFDARFSALENFWDAFKTTEVEKLQKMMDNDEITVNVAKINGYCGEITAGQENAKRAYLYTIQNINKAKGTIGTLQRVFLMFGVRLEIIPWYDERFKVWAESSAIPPDDCSLLIYAYLESGCLSEDSYELLLKILDLLLDVCAHITHFELIKNFTDYMELFEEFLVTEYNMHHCSPWDWRKAKEPWCDHLGIANGVFNIHHGGTDKCSHLYHEHTGIYAHGDCNAKDRYYECTIERVDVAIPDNRIIAGEQKMLIGYENPIRFPVYDEFNQPIELGGGNCPQPNTFVPKAGKNWLGDYWHAGEFLSTDPDNLREDIYLMAGSFFECLDEFDYCGSPGLTTQCPFEDTMPLFEEMPVMHMALKPLCSIQDWRDVKDECHTMGIAWGPEDVYEKQVFTYPITEWVDNPNYIDPDAAPDPNGDGAVIVEEDCDDETFALAFLDLVESGLPITPQVYGCDPQSTVIGGGSGGEDPGEGVDTTSPKIWVTYDVERLVDVVIDTIEPDCHFRTDVAIPDTVVLRAGENVPMVGFEKPVRNPTYGAPFVLKTGEGYKAGQFNSDFFLKAGDPFECVTEFENYPNAGHTTQAPFTDHHNTLDEHLDMNMALKPLCSIQDWRVVREECEHLGIAWGPIDIIETQVHIEEKIIWIDDPDYVPPTPCGGTVELPPCDDDYFTLSFLDPLDIGVPFTPEVYGCGEGTETVPGDCGGDPIVGDCDSDDFMILSFLDLAEIGIPFTPEVYGCIPDYTPPPEEEEEEETEIPQIPVTIEYERVREVIVASIPQECDFRTDVAVPDQVLRSGENIPIAGFENPERNPIMGDGFIPKTGEGYKAGQFISDTFLKAGDFEQCVTDFIIESNNSGLINRSFSDTMDLYEEFSMGYVKPSFCDNYNWRLARDGLIHLAIATPETMECEGFMHAAIPDQEVVAGENTPIAGFEMPLRTAIMGTTFTPLAGDVWHAGELISDCTVAGDWRNELEDFEREASPVIAP